MKTQERSSFESGVSKGAFKSKISWVIYNRNKSGCSKTAPFFKGSFQVWLFLTVLDSVQWFFRTFLGCNKHCIYRLPLVHGKLSFDLFSRSLPVPVFATDLLLLCFCSALQLLHSGCSQEEHKFSWIPCTASLKESQSVKTGKHLHLLHPLFSRTEHGVKQSRMQAEVKQLYNPSLCPSLIPSPSSDLFKFPATVSYNHLFGWLETRFWILLSSDFVFLTDWSAPHTMEPNFLSSPWPLWEHR